MSVLPIYIGCCPTGKDDLAADVLEHSIRVNTPAEVTFHRIGDGTGDTGFSAARWQLCHEEGFAIYLDSDMLVFKDIRQLWAYRRQGKWIGTQTRKSKCASVSVVDCGAMPHITTLRDLRAAGYYESNIPEVWNWMDMTPTEETCLLHYTHQKLQPWKDEAPKDREIDKLWLTYMHRIQ